LSVPPAGYSTQTPGFVEITDPELSFQLRNGRPPAEVAAAVSVTEF
jgi:hypothetical protein